MSIRDGRPEDKLKCGDGRGTYPPVERRVRIFWLYEIACPICAHVGRYSVDPNEHSPLVTLLYCDVEQGGCDRQFAVEVCLHVRVEVHTCRLTLPSTTVTDALVELSTLPEPDDEIPY